MYAGTVSPRSGFDDCAPIGRRTTRRFHRKEHVANDGPYLIRNYITRHEVKSL